MSSKGFSELVIIHQKGYAKGTLMTISNVYIATRL
jgi:hypothetical protein